MTQPPPQQGRWTFRRWAWSAAIVFGLQVVAIGWLAERRWPDRPPPEPRTALELLPEHLARQWWDDLDRMTMDPTLFILAQANNFSGPAWRNLKLQRHQYRERRDEPSRWTLPPDLLAQWPLPPDAIRSRLPVASRGPLRLAQPQVESMTVSTQSLLRIESGSGELELAQAPPLPVWTAADVLAATTVQVLVNPEGEPWTVQMAGPSGWAPADSEALRLAAQLRFRILHPSRAAGQGSEAGGPRAAKVAFNWATVAPTNTPAPATP